MATIVRRKWGDGSTTFLATIRIKGFNTNSKTFESKAAAIEWATGVEKQLRDQRKRGAVREDVAKLTIAGLIREYLADDRTKSLRTYEGVKQTLAWWTNEHPTVRVIDFGADLLLKSRTKLLIGRKPATVNRYLSSMRSAWIWGMGMRLIAAERAWPLRLALKEPGGRTRFLNDDEIARVLAATADDPVMNAAIVLSLATGLRQGELLRLTWADIDLERGKLTVHESKNGEKRAVHVLPNAIDALKKLKKLPLTSLVRVFVNAEGKPLKDYELDRRWRKIRKAANLTDFHWHDLRHTCASILVQSGASLLMVGTVLGHKSPNMTMRYSHLVQGAAVTGHDVLNAKLGTPKK